MATTIPTFSIFSAISEVFVTIAVVFTIWRAMRGHAFHRVLLGVTLLFESCINVIYMAGRASHADTSSTLSTGMKIFYASHGMLSILMLLGLIVVYVLALLDTSSGRETWFRRHPGYTYVFLFFWMVSVVSGEVIFVMTYFGGGASSA